MTSTPAETAPQLCHSTSGDLYCPTCHVRYAGTHPQSGYGERCGVCITPLLRFADLSPQPGPSKGIWVVQVPATPGRSVAQQRRHREYCRALAAMAPAQRATALADPLSCWQGPLPRQPWEPGGMPAR